MGLIYLTSGIGGNIISGVISPYTPCVGASSAVGGLLGVSFVDMFGSWQFLTSPWKPLFTLVLEAIFFLLVGTLPYFDIWAMLGGCFFGIISAFILLPYITVGKWQAFRKKCLVAVSIPLLIVFFVCFLVLFYNVSSICPNCDVIQCINYISGLCSAEN